MLKSDEIVSEFRECSMFSENGKKYGYVHIVQGLLLNFAKFQISLKFPKPNNFSNFQFTPQGRRAGRSKAWMREKASSDARVRGAAFVAARDRSPTLKKNVSILKSQTRHALKRACLFTSHQILKNTCFEKRD